MGISCIVRGRMQPARPPPAVSSSAVRDGLLCHLHEVRADHVASFLAEYRPEDRPLMLSVGFAKPHVDWVVPKEYFDLYPLDDIVLDGIAPNDTDDIAAYILDTLGEHVPWTPEDATDIPTVKLLIQAYLASISFVDAQIGKVLDALDASAIADDTTVMLWSDHGHHLGDKDLWQKFTLWDEAGRAPLIIRDPDIGTPGTRVDDVVEMMDIFPTVLDLMGIDDSGLELRGDSLVPYMQGNPPESENVAYTWVYGNVSIRTDDSVISGSSTRLCGSTMLWSARWAAAGETAATANASPAATTQPRRLPAGVRAQSFGRKGRGLVRITGLLLGVISGGCGVQRPTVRDTDRGGPGAQPVRNTASGSRLNARGGGIRGCKKEDRPHKGGRSIGSGYQSRRCISGDDGRRPSHRGRAARGRRGPGRHRRSG